MSVTDTFSEVRADLDDLDRRLINALHIDGRAPFSKIATMLGVSTQTISRRYRRLCAETALRVVGVATPQQSSQVQWMVRLTTDPETGDSLADGLARRPDTSWVKLASEGTEIFAIVTAPDGIASSSAVLLRDIGGSHGITTMSAHYLLHIYLGGPTAWRGRVSALNDHEREQLRLLGMNAQGLNDRHTVADDMTDLLPALQRDGRTSLVDLAEATGWSPAKVARRLEVLQSSGALFFDVEIDDRQLGANSHAMLWMSVVPAHVERVGAALAQHYEIAFVAATTGPTNLVAVALCSGPNDLHDYLVYRLATLDAIRSLEVAPVVRTVKATGTIVVDEPAPRGPRDNVRLIVG